LFAWEIVGFIIVFGLGGGKDGEDFFISRSEGGYSTPSASSFYNLLGIYEGKNKKVCY